MKLCDWCGRTHDRRALCPSRPTWGRRGFLQLLGAAALGYVAQPLQAFAPQPRPLRIHPMSIDASGAVFVATMYIRSVLLPTAALVQLQTSDSLLGPWVNIGVVENVR